LPNQKRQNTQFDTFRARPTFASSSPPLGCSTSLPVPLICEKVTILFARTPNANGRGSRSLQSECTQNAKFRRLPDRHTNSVLEGASILSRSFRPCFLERQIANQANSCSRLSLFCWSSRHQKWIFNSLASPRTWPSPSKTMTHDPIWVQFASSGRFGRSLEPRNHYRIA
jgi:hypothetical protein